MLYQYSTKYDDLLEQAFINDPFYAVDSFAYKEQLADVTAQWLMEKEKWRIFFSFTFREEG